MPLNVPPDQQGKSQGTTEPENPYTTKLLLDDGGVEISRAFSRLRRLPGCFPWWVGQSLTLCCVERRPNARECGS
jgi:hypothetical protein